MVIKEFEKIDIAQKINFDIGDLDGKIELKRCI